VAVLVNLWLLLRLYSSQLSSAIGRVLALLSSNMSALSSMRFVATTSNLVDRNLARFATTLLVHAAAIQVRTQPNHIKGKFNHLEDFLSCSEAGQTPLWERVIEQCSHLHHCPIYFLHTHLYKLQPPPNCSVGSQTLPKHAICYRC
jgi:hypothetical protein